MIFLTRFFPPRFTPISAVIAVQGYRNYSNLSRIMRQTPGKRPGSAGEKTITAKQYCNNKNNIRYIFRVSFRVIRIVQRFSNDVNLTQYRYNVIILYTLSFWLRACIINCMNRMRLKYS